MSSRSQRRETQAELAATYARQQQARQERHVSPPPASSPLYCALSKTGWHDFSMGRQRRCWYCGRRREVC